MKNRFQALTDMENMENDTIEDKWRKIQIAFTEACDSVLGFNPSAWSDERCSHSINITCRGETSTARTLHSLTHSTISRQHREIM